MTDKKRNDRVTAAELLARLGADPGFVARQEQQERARQEQSDDLSRAEAPLVDELRAAGFEVDSVWDLVNISTPYREALPILLKHLHLPYPGRVKEGIARALAVPDAKFGWAQLKELYRSEQSEAARDGLAVALSAIADDELIGDVINLARDERLGDSRLLLLRALERSLEPDARAALMDLGTDPVLAKEIQIILRRLKRQRREI
jgi:hypothetical protein